MTSVDGRRLGVHVLNEGTGRTVVFCHPAPGAGTFDPDPDATRARDVTLLAVDRPGYGDSDPIGADSWASVDGAAADIIAVLDDLGIDRVSVALEMAPGAGHLLVIPRWSRVLSHLAPGR
jgi:pimeloyl-ACP methyl ester carboxylesterase